MSNARLLELQAILKKHNIDLYYMNTSDYHMSEYVPEYFKTIAYFSGFTGSLATLLVSQNDAHIFVDGRYYGQADNQCIPNDVKVVKLGKKNEPSVMEFILKNYADKVIGIDGKRTSIDFAKQLIKNKIKIKSIDAYSQIIEDRAPLSSEKITELALKYTGLTRKKKLELILHVLNGKTHIVNNLESIAYILNLRSTDIIHTPVFMSYLVFSESKVHLFVDKNRFDGKTLDKIFDDAVIVRPYESYYDFLETIKNQTIVLDENKVNYETYLKVNKNKNKIYNMRSLIEDMKSIKNGVEQANCRLAHIYDGVVMLRFMMWLDNEDKSKLNEYDVKKKLDEFRLSYKAYDSSFEAIVAYNANAAMMHYSPSAKKSSKLNNKGILLVDTGGQYLQGTTDTTRTICLGPVSDEIKKYFTLVLKSMFNLSEIKFLRGINGSQIDIIARKDLWEVGVDYRCGTGHGIGHNLSVHETPPNIRYMKSDNKSNEVEIKPGMIFSDEPGVYFEGKFGIRCENNILCQKDSSNEYGEFLKFETLTMVPFDNRLIDKKYLDKKTIDCLNNYHQKVYDNLLPYLDEKEAAYLRKMTKKI